MSTEEESIECNSKHITASLGFNCTFPVSKARWQVYITCFVIKKIFFLPRTLQISQRFASGKGFDGVLPLPVETLFHLWKEDYSQIPAPV